MARSLLLVALVCAAFAGVRGSRSLLQGAVPAPGPSYAPAPTAQINGAPAFNCPTPGSTGYLFQPAPCNFGTYAGLAVYCDESKEGAGIVGIRGSSTGNCTATSSCPTGQFCSAQTANNGTCTPVADPLCFAGALPPSPGPAPAAQPTAATSSATAPVASDATSTSTIAPVLTGVPAASDPGTSTSAATPV